MGRLRDFHSPLGGDPLGDELLYVLIVFGVIL
jgi:hypothetical protein